MGEKINFRPVQGTEEKIKKVPQQNGYFYVATDTGRIYLDTAEKNKLPLGSSGVSVIYGNAKEIEVEKDEDGNPILYYIKIEDIENSNCHVDDLILNSDGSFYKVKSLGINDSGDKIAKCEKLTVSGGSSDADHQVRGEVVITRNCEANLLNDEPASITLMIKSMTYGGDPVATDITGKLTISYKDGDNTIEYYSSEDIYAHGKAKTIDLTNILRKSVSSIIEFTALPQTGNIFKTPTTSVLIAKHELSLEWQKFSNENYVDNYISVGWKMTQGVKRSIQVFFDDYLVCDKYYSDSSVTAVDGQTDDDPLSDSFIITQNTKILNPLDSETTLVNKYTHGAHKIKAKLYLNSDSNTKGNGTDEIVKEIAIKKYGNPLPLIWTGDYKAEYYDYETIRIPFKVYDPDIAHSTIPILLYKNGVLLNTREISNNAGWQYWEISDLVLNDSAYYTIEAGIEPNKTRREFSFVIKKDPIRDMKIINDETLVVNLNTIGRDNSEGILSRQTWTVKDGKSAIFKDFNWYNNGWVLDDNHNTCLRISNGASVSIPIGSLTFDGSGSNEAHTIEFQFKLRNPQDYRKALTKYTRYKGNQESENFKAWTDNEAWAAFLEQLKTTKDYTNYDKFLTKKYFVEHPDGPQSIDDIEYNFTYNMFDFNNLVCAYGVQNVNNPLGIYFSPQDAMFCSGDETVSVDFIENQMLYLSFVYTGGSISNKTGGSERLLQVYLNGVLTSIARCTNSDAWTINSDTIDFFSDTCDIDLYHIRVYDRGLSIPEIVQNYAFDLKNIKYWDQKNLYENNIEINDDVFSFSQMEIYNRNHTDAPLMPYIIIRTLAGDNRLPYSKEAKATAGTLEFVNVPLDMAYASGELQKVVDQANKKVKGTWESVNDYYIHHCPSFITSYGNAKFSVQGTSSQFYPRRNYKAKCKDSGMFLHKGPYEKIYKDEYNQGLLGKDNPAAECYLSKFYMDNKTVGTNKFTLKVDYMESSGDYNRGFANLVNNVYSYHPLRDYNETKTFCSYDPPKETTEYIAGNLYKYYNHKDNLKITDGNDDNLIITSKEDFDLGPYALYQKLMAENPTLYTKLKVAGPKSAYYNKWYVNKESGYSPYTVEHLEDYRTSVQGYPVLAFQWPADKDGNYKNKEDIIYLGKYNMLLDKGSDECYGFDLSSKVLSTTLNNAKVSDMAECWEFQNNSRTYCSFRDPWNRYKLSFRGPKGDTNEFTKKGAPFVADSFEPRYTPNDDIIAKTLFKIGTISDADGTKTSSIAKSLVNTAPRYLTFNKVQQGDITVNEWTIQNPGQAAVKFDLTNTDKTNGRELLLALMSNWEEAVAWVWSTCLDCTIEFEDGTKEPIPSMGVYTEKKLAEALYQANTYYIKNEDNTFSLDNGVFSADIKYFNKIKTDQDEVDYIPIILTNDENKLYKKDTFYILKDADNGIYTLCSDSNFNPSETYYTMVQNEDNIDNRWLLKDAEGNPITVIYNNTRYTKDSKEYRQAKFVNELSKHFSIEYLATYFLMTEIFECYDSRGKNAMFASWGPQKDNNENIQYIKNGETEIRTQSNSCYIWYPIFYDIDTQLGINNTGIPSFEYYVDATEDGTFSTNDSVLWNNFFTFFKDKVVDKYLQLMNKSQESYPTGNVKAIFETGSNTNDLKCDIVDKWYQTSPEVITDSYAVKGDRPLLALNLDEEFKYIIPTNSKAENTIFGRLTDEGKYSTEKDQYFYALQGDRNLYRTQFLSNRLNYIDSWLTVGNYARGGTNRIRSRISANNPISTSDRWIQGTNTNGMKLENSQYWKDNKEFGEKTHEFDGEYWIELEPARNAYVTVGTDTSNFPSQKYKGDGNSVKFTAPDLKKGIMESGNYREQLYYIYGLDQMKSLGDLSKLYFQEFELQGKVDKLTDLLLGYDGVVSEPNSEGKLTQYSYYNNEVNAWSYASMPLLKEMNLCNIKFKNQQQIDLSDSQKLQNFRNTGSNINKVEFAEGVALDTLYLTRDTTYLSLIEAKLLNKLITTYVYPTKDPITKKLKVADENKGLYIQGLTDKSDSDITTAITYLEIQGGNLDYYSYDLLNRYYQGCLNSNLSGCKINFTNVQWSPYRLLQEDLDSFNSKLEYYKDTGHFTLEKITDVSTITKSDIKNNLIYYKDNTINNLKTIENYDLLKNLYEDTHFIGMNSSPHPNITGYIYINNSDYIAEEVIQDDFQSKYPNLTIFFEKVTLGYSAQFVYEDYDSKDSSVMIRKVLKTQKLPATADENLFFASPIDSNSVNYISFDSLQDKMPTYDFKGWKLVETDTIVISADIIDNKPVIKEDNWSNLKLSKDIKTYTFKAIFERKHYTITFVNGDGTKIPVVFNYGEQIKQPSDFYYYNIDTVTSGVGLYETWKHVGWSAIGPEGALIDLNTQLAFSERTFYAVGKLVPISENILDSKYYTSGINSNGKRYIRINKDANLKGKVTLPAKIDGSYVEIIQSPVTYDWSSRPQPDGFYRNKNITGVFIYPIEDNHLSIIESGAFYLCTNLRYFSFSSYMSSIGSNAFFNADLSEVSILPYSSASEGLTIEERAFYSSTPSSTYPGYCKIGSGNESCTFIIEGAKILTIQSNAFGNRRVLQTKSGVITEITSFLNLELGSKQHLLTTVNIAGNAFNMYSGYKTTSARPSHLRIYCPTSSTETMTTIGQNIINGANGVYDSGPEIVNR